MFGRAKIIIRRTFILKNVYPKDYQRLESHLRPLRTYAVELREGDVWVDLE